MFPFICGLGSSSCCLCSPSLKLQGSCFIFVDTINTIPRRTGLLLRGLNLMYPYVVFHWFVWLTEHKIDCSWLKNSAQNRVFNKCKVQLKLWISSLVSNYRGEVDKWLTNTSSESIPGLSFGKDMMTWFDLAKIKHCWNERSNWCLQASCIYQILSGDHVLLLILGLPPFGIKKIDFPQNPLKKKTFNIKFTMRTCLMLAY